MEVIASPVDIACTTEACFIERASFVKPWNGTIIKYWLAQVNHHLRYADYMKETVVLASQNEDLTWEAIRAADHIWCQSFFMGDSAQLFTRLLNRAVAEGVRDKVLFNLADRPEAYSELFSSEPNAPGLIKTLKLNQNIKFFFWEEIAEMMHVSIYP